MWIVGGWVINVGGVCDFVVGSSGIVGGVGGFSCWCVCGE